MSDGDALLRAILDDPDDDAPRLVLPTGSTSRGTPRGLSSFARRSNWHACLRMIRLAMDWFKRNEHCGGHTVPPGRNGCQVGLVSPSFDGDFSKKFAVKPPTSWPESMALVGRLLSWPCVSTAWINSPLWSFKVGYCTGCEAYASGMAFLQPPGSSWPSAPIWENYIGLTSGRVPTPIVS